ncbi:MAG: catechol 2,3-dioxygenase [Rhodospirillaceae bacterium]|jgi:catechol 2,3-dioxygenase|nr:catechol 2,3-dioxygenase [Rhodospirillaceae bacterium]MBT6139139.1 catechol 2,3-dioxygenase [Rhodospirillaceae bacterium]
MTEIAEPIQDVAHLGHVELLTPKLEESERYFTDILGMEAVHREEASVFLRGYGDYATYTLKLTQAEKPGVGGIGWRTVSDAALERRVAAIEATGLGLGWSNGGFAHGRAYRFRDPDGHVMELYYEQEKYVAPEHLKSRLRNQPMRLPTHGIGVRRIDHLAILCRDVPANRSFAEETLGLRLREQVRFNDGATEIGSWMSNNAVHHEIAFVLDTKQVGGRLHHLGLWVDNREDVLRAADLFMENDVFIEAGPSKHNNSQAFYIYSREPGGNRVEIYSGGMIVLDPDFEPVVWNEEQRGTGVYWGAALPASFLDYATPHTE